MIKRQQPYFRQLQMCINDRKGESPSCEFSGSEEMVAELEKVAKERNLKGKLRVAKSGCMDLCAFGPNLGGYLVHEGHQGRHTGDHRYLLEAARVGQCAGRHLPRSHGEVIRSRVLH